MTAQSPHAASEGFDLKSRRNRSAQGMGRDGDECAYILTCLLLQCRYCFTQAASYHRPYALPHETCSTSPFVSRSTIEMATYLVTQATGAQSQWVIKHLLNSGAKVHAVVRDLNKVPPALKDSSITLFQGESQNSEEIFQAAQGCKGVFLNTFPIPGLETGQAKGVVEGCLKAGVESIVASTAYLSNNKAMWDDPATDEGQLRDYFISKGAVEDVIRGASFKAYTIIRPAVISHDYMLPHSYYNFPELPTQGELAHCLDDSTKLPHTDSYDLGKYAAAALQDPAKFGGQEIDFFNELLTIGEVRDVIAKVSGKDVRLRRRTSEEAQAVLKTVFGQRFHFVANAKDFSAATAVVKEVPAKFGIPFTSLEETLQRQRTLLVESLPA